PATIGDGIDVVMAGVDVEALRGQSACANMENNGKAFARNGKQNFLHQDKALSGCKIRDPAACYGKTFACTCSTVLEFGLDKCKIFAPQVLFTVRDFDLIAASHGCGRCDRIGTGALCDVGI